MTAPSRVGPVAVVCLAALVAAVTVAGAAGTVGAQVDAGAPAGAPADAQQTGPEPGAAIQESVDPDVVVMRVELAEDGTAAWSVAFRTRLDDENATAAFESLRADVAANESAYTEQFATGMGRTVASAENATGREMALRNLTVEATTEQFGQQYGVVTYRFTWTNFATVEGDRIHAGDALSGLFLDGETTLVVAWPEGYELDSATPEPAETREDEVVWHGQLDFGPDQPRIVAAPAGGLNAALVVAAVLGLLVVAGAAWAVRSRGTADSLLPGVSAGASAEEPAEGTDGASADADEGDGEADDGPPEELLSNEERVLQLLEDEGGRIKQQRIAGEFDWTDAKTSQVVGSLRDDDAVETFRIGRENVVTLPEESDL